MYVGMCVCQQLNNWTYVYKVKGYSSQLPNNMLLLAQTDVISTPHQPEVKQPLCKAKKVSPSPERNAIALGNSHH